MKLLNNTLSYAQESQNRSTGVLPQSEASEAAKQTKSTHMAPVRLLRQIATIAAGTVLASRLNLVEGSGLRQLAVNHLDSRHYTWAPTLAPTLTSTGMPTSAPTLPPTPAPTANPQTATPSSAPVLQPTAALTGQPSLTPSLAPMASPTQPETASPSVVPSHLPTVSMTPLPTPMLSGLSSEPSSLEVATTSPSLDPGFVDATEQPSAIDLGTARPILVTPAPAVSPTQGSDDNRVGSSDDDINWAIWGSVAAAGVLMLGGGIFILRRQSQDRDDEDQVSIDSDAFFDSSDGAVFGEQAL